MKADVGADNVMYIHTTLLLTSRLLVRMKTKPTQHSVKELRGLGIQPNMLVIRTEKPAGQGIKNKLAQFCDVAPEAVYRVFGCRTSLPNSIEFAGARYGPNCL